MLETLLITGVILLALILLVLIIAVFSFRNFMNDLGMGEIDSDWDEFENYDYFN